MPQQLADSQQKLASTSKRFDTQLLQIFLFQTQKYFPMDLILYQLLSKFLGRSASGRNSSLTQQPRGGAGARGHGRPMQHVDLRTFLHVASQELGDAPDVSEDLRELFSVFDEHNTGILKAHAFFEGLAPGSYDAYEKEIIRRQKAEEELTKSKQRQLAQAKHEGPEVMTIEAFFKWIMERYGHFQGEDPVLTLLEVWFNHLDWDGDGNLTKKEWSITLRTAGCVGNLNSI